MIIYFCNYQDHEDANNWRAISAVDELGELLDRMRDGKPVIAHLSGPGDFRVEFGIGGDFGCIQISRMDDKPPYLVAVSHHPCMKRGYVEFLCGGTPTPIGASNILSYGEMREVLIDFM